MCFCHAFETSNHIQGSEVGDTNSYILTNYCKDRRGNEVNNEDLRYQWGDVVNIVARDWIWTAHSTKGARGCVSQHMQMKKNNFLARDCKSCCLILSAFFSRRRSKDIRFQAFARWFSGSWEKKSLPEKCFFFSRPFFAGSMDMAIPKKIRAPKSSFFFRFRMSKCALYAQVELTRRGHYCPSVCNKTRC